MWFDNPIFQKVDARLQMSESISEQWKAKVYNPPYLNSSDGLYESLWGR